ncbi:MAG: hypothetical protein FWE60_02990 [Oscillospiraceae bacterium]|nr:hypothetical protein [Oscillospiraceae bacterium]
MKTKLIKIICGTYPYRKDEKSTSEAKNKNSPPFEVAEAEAKRLVGLKVAEYADKPQKDENDG